MGKRLFEGVDHKIKELSQEEGVKAAGLLNLQGMLVSAQNVSSKEAAFAASLFHNAKQLSSDDQKPVILVEGEHSNSLIKGDEDYLLLVRKSNS